MTVATKRRHAPAELDRAYYESKVAFLEHENAILRNALDELKRNLVEKEKELEIVHGDLVSMTDHCTSFQNRYFTAKALINIPDNISDLVEELVKTRLMLWDKTVVDVLTDPETFEALDELNDVFPPKANGKGKRKGKK